MCVGTLEADNTGRSCEGGPTLRLLPAALVTCGLMYWGARRELGRPLASSCDFLGFLVGLADLLRLLLLEVACPEAPDADAADVSIPGCPGEDLTLALRARRLPAAARGGVTL